MSEVELNPTFDGFRKKLGRIVYVNIDGDTFARRYRKPKNPNTPAQIEVRESFKKLSEDWKMMDGVLKQSWSEIAKRKKRVKGYNAFIGANSTRQRAGEFLVLCPALGIQDTLPFTPSPGPNPGEISLTFTPANGGRHLTVFSQIKEEGRASGPLTRHDAGADAPSPYLVTGLESGREYHLYAVLTDAPYETAARVSASTGGAGMAG